MKKPDIMKFINPKYINWIRQVFSERDLNIQNICNILNIPKGNTYFRNFILNKRDQQLGMSNLESIIDYDNKKIMIVVIDKDDLTSEQVIEDMNTRSFNEIVSAMESIADKSIKIQKPKIYREKKIVKDEGLILNSILGGGNTIDLDDMFNDDITIGTLDDDESDDDENQPDYGMILP
ncbi:MAG: hypothetical protein WC136_00355 [Sphaerochaeta sp.]|jgi:hypothetical protein